MEYSVVKFSTNMLKEHGIDYINDCRKIFFEEVYDKKRGTLLVIVENQADDDGQAMRFDADCFELMKLFFEDLLFSFKDRKKDVLESKETISKTYDV